MSSSSAVILRMFLSLFDGQGHCPDHTRAKWQKRYHQHTAAGGQHSYWNATEGSEKREVVDSELFIQREDGVEPEQTHLIMCHLENK